MYLIHTDNYNEQIRLDRDFLMKNGCYMLPHKQLVLVGEMLTAISYQFFQNKIPLLVEKVQEMLINSLSCTYSLTTYREVMSILKKENQSMQIYREHLIAMNRAFAGDQKGLQLDNEEDQEDQDFIFQQALKGQRHSYSTLEQLFQLPLGSQPQNCESSDTKTDKTVKSDVEWTHLARKDSLKIEGFGTATKFENMFACVNSDIIFEGWKTNGKQQTRQQTQQTSRQMSSFHKKGSTILDVNRDLDQMLASEVKYDLNRQITLGSQIGLQDTPQKPNYQKKIRNTLMNIKLRPRRK